MNAVVQSIFQIPRHISCNKGEKRAIRVVEFQNLPINSVNNRVEVKELSNSLVDKVMRNAYILVAVFASFVIHTPQLNKIRLVTNRMEKENRAYQTVEMRNALCSHCLRCIYTLLLAPNPLFSLVFWPWKMFIELAVNVERSIDDGEVVFNGGNIIFYIRINFDDWGIINV